MGSDILLTADNANSINELVEKRIDPGLFFFCNYEPIPQITKDPVGLFLIKLNNFYKLFKDSAWLLFDLPYIYTGNKRVDHSTLPFPQKAINSIFRETNDLRTGFCHNISSNNGDGITIDHINQWFIHHRPKGSTDFESLIKGIDDDTNTVIKACERFINSIGDLHNPDRANAIERWKQVIIDHYADKKDIVFHMIGSYYNSLHPSQSSTKPNKFKENVVKPILISYYAYDFDQYLKKLDYIKSTVGKSKGAMEKIDNILDSVYNEWDNRAYSIFGTADHKLFYDGSSRERLIDHFFEKELGNAINEVFSKERCPLLPQHIINKVFSLHTVFDAFTTEFDRFDFSERHF